MRLSTKAKLPFHARVIAARLGTEGIVTDLRGNIDGLYPVGDVHVFVDQEDLEEAREILLVDDIESAFDEPEDMADLGAPPALWLVLGAILGIAAVLFSRTF
jgi:hypothetical protein